MEIKIVKIVKYEESGFTYAESGELSPFVIADIVCDAPEGTQTTLLTIIDGVVSFEGKTISLLESNCFAIAAAYYKI